jgi:hypothetical protein
MSFRHRRLGGGWYAPRKQEKERGGGRRKRRRRKNRREEGEEGGRGRKREEEEEANETSPELIFFEEPINSGSRTHTRDTAKSENQRGLITCFLCLLLRDLNRRVNPLLVIDRRQVLLWPSPDSWDLAALGRSYAHDLDRFRLLFQIPGSTHDGSRGPH